MGPAQLAACCGLPSPPIRPLLQALALAQPTGSLRKIALEGVGPWRIPDHALIPAES